MKTSSALDIYSGKRDKFYYLISSDKVVMRDNKISALFDEPVTYYYYTPLGDTSEIFSAKFWKNKGSITSVNKGSYKVVEISSDDFIKLIPDDIEIAEKSYYNVNLKIKRKEIEYQNIWKEYRKKYKAIEAYKKVTSPSLWLPCPDCKLIPLVWEFNNGRSTACGCGENEYQHHSISAESIMSYVTRNNGSALDYNGDELRINWNKWCMYKVDIFSQRKENNDSLW